MALPATTYDTATLVNPGSSLTDFTLIVDLSRMSAAWWAAVDTSDGTKGRAAKDSGPTELACDWIDFDDSAETGLLRVKWSGTLASSGTQTLRIYPPQAANASVAANATYGSDNAYDSDWAAYWPLHDANDRTANGYDLTAQGGVTAGGVSGKLDAATDFDGTDDGFWIVDTEIVTNPGTVMAWANPDVNSVNYAVWWAQTSVGTGTRRVLLSFTLYRGRETGTSTGEAINFTTVPTSTWSMSTFQMASSTSRYTWFDKNKSSQNTTDPSIANPTDDLGIGKSTTNDAPFNGSIQHVQVHSVSRADDWIEYEYDQTNDQATFWGTWTNVPVAAGISIPVVMHHRRMMGVS